MNSRSRLLDTALPCEGQADVVFAEPWEATAFALIVSLSRAGYFTWPEWVECFSKEVAIATEIEARGDKPPSYYEQWLAAAEKIVEQKGLASIDQLRAKKLGIAAAGAAHVLKGATRKPLTVA